MMSFSQFPKSRNAAQAKDPIAQMMAGFTGFAVAVTLILVTAIPVTAIPVKADRKADACTTPAACTLQLD
jgi:hypothetical protein